MGLDQLASQVRQNADQSAGSNRWRSKIVRQQADAGASRCCPTTDRPAASLAPISLGSVQVRYEIYRIG